MNLNELQNQSDIVLFQNLNYPDSNEKIIEWLFVVVEDDVRIWFKPTIIDGNGGYGFDFYATKFHSEIIFDNNKYEPYQSPGFAAECLFFGSAYWDSVRHIRMGDKQTDNENYLYYVSPDIIHKVMKKISELEEKYCAEQID